MSNYRGFFLKQGLILIILVILPISSILPFINNNSESFWVAGVFSSLLVLGLFYLNYLWLAPKFFYHNKKLAYFILAIISVIIFVLCMRLILSSMRLNSDFEFVGFNSRKLGAFILLRIVLTFILSWFLIVYEKFEKEKTEKKNVELEFLKSQYNPHFLFNALNSIYAKTIDVSDDASSLILKLSSLLRYNLNLNSSEKIPLIEEINNINNYFDLQKIRLSENVELIKEINIMKSNYFISPFLFIPLIENAFKYGANTTDICKIYISLSLEGKQLIFFVQNKKNVIDHNIISTEGFGLGMNNVKKLLELNYPNNYHFNIEDGNEIYKVTVKINLQ